VINQSTTLLSTPPAFSDGCCWVLGSFAGSVTGTNAKACCDAAVAIRKSVAVNFMVVIVMVQYCGDRGGIGIVMTTMTLSSRRALISVMCNLA
jgi:hypothetical protein